MSDLVARLRAESENWKVGDCVLEAATLLETQAKQLEVAREALEKISASGFGLQGIAEDYGHDDNAYNYHAMKYWAQSSTARQNRARSALKDMDLVNPLQQE